MTDADTCDTGPNAAQQSDLRAAIRAATERSDGDASRAAVDMLLPRLRGAVVGSEELRQAQARVQQEDGAAATTGSGLDDGIQELLVRLALGDLERLVVVDLDVDGWRMCVLRADEDSVVHADPVVGPADVAAALLPATHDELTRRYLLAGGVLDGQDGNWRDFAAVAGYAQERLVEMGPFGAGTELVLVRRRAGWRVLDELALALRAMVVPTLDTLPAWRRSELAVLADQWCAAGPLRHGYDLAVVAVAPEDGRITVVTHPLFRAGAPAVHGEGRRVSVTVARPDGGPGQVLLPVLRAGTEAIADRTAVALPVVMVPGAVTVDLAVPRPGRVEVTAIHPVDGSAPSWSPGTPSTRSWAEVAAEMPLYDAFDVVLAVELAGEVSRVDRRLEAALNLVRALHAREARAPGAVQVAAIGFTDHRGTARPGPAVCTEAGFAAPVELLDQLNRWQRVVANDPYGSAVEDGLHVAAGQKWRRGVLRTLVVIGSRPPSVIRPAPTRYVVCPSQLDWRHELDTLQTRLSVRTVAVVDLPGWCVRPDIDDPVDRTRGLWDAVGRDGRFELDGLHVPDLERVVVPGPAARVRLVMRTEDGRA